MRAACAGDTGDHIYGFLNQTALESSTSVHDELFVDGAQTGRFIDCRPVTLPATQAHNYLSRNSASLERCICCEFIDTRPSQLYDRLKSCFVTPAFHLLTTQEVSIIIIIRVRSSLMVPSGATGYVAGPTFSVAPQMVRNGRPVHNCLSPRSAVQSVPFPLRKRVDFPVKPPGHLGGGTSRMSDALNVDLVARVRGKGADRSQHR